MASRAMRARSPDPVVREAIAWWARLQSGVADAHEREAWQAWVERDPAHSRAWERVESIGRDVRRVPAALARAALADPRRPDRRAALRAVFAVAGACMTGWLGYRYAPWQRLAADLSTGIGERRRLAVGDGLHITLNGDSAVRVRRTGGMHDVHLLRGEILVLMRSRPLWGGLRVDTGYGILRIETAHFDVSRSHCGARVGVYDGSVALWREPESLRVDAGERLIYGEHGRAERQRTDPDDLAWTEGLVVAKDWRLDDFAEYLGRQRFGLIRVDPAVAGLRLSGVFPLDDAERALRTLEPILPVVVTRHTPLWLQVDPRGA